VVVGGLGVCGVPAQVKVIIVELLLRPNAFWLYTIKLYVSPNTRLVTVTVFIDKV